MHVDSIIKLLFGSKFVESANCLRILIWMFIPYCGYIVTMFYLNSAGEIKYVMKVSILGLIINILLNLYLIPQQSMYGASIATIITEVFVFIGVILKTLEEYKEVNKNAFIVKLFFISFSGLLLAINLPEFYQSVFFLCYFLLFIYLFRIIDAEEQYALKFIYNSFTDKFRNKKS